MKELSEFKAIIPDVFELWRDLTSQHYIPAAKSARQFVERMTGTLFITGWEDQYKRHGTVWPPNSGSQLHPDIADAENEIVSRLVNFVMEPQPTRLFLAVGACERFLREGDVELPERGQVILPVPGPLLWPASNILGVSKQAVTLGKSIVKIRELNPHEKGLVIDDWVPFTSAMSTLAACMAPSCPTEDPRGGQVPIHQRSTHAVWFSANPEVEKLFQAIWDARRDLPATFTQFERNLTDQNLSLFKSALRDFEELVARFHAWHESICPKSTFFSPPSTPSFPGTAAEYSSMLRSIRQSQYAEAIAEARVVPVSENAGVKPFEAGNLAFFNDRVELCGVDICSGPKSVPARKVLDSLRKKRSDGTFVAYGGKQLAESTGNKGASIRGLIRDLRNRISAVLLSASGIQCGSQDVILSGGEGYRFSTNLSVQDGDPETDESQQGHHVPSAAADDPNRDPNDPNRDDPNDPIPVDPIDPNGAGKAATTRRNWIMQQLTEGRQLRAPNVVKQFGCSLATAKRDLQALKDAGKIEFYGENLRTGYYRLKT